MTVHYPKGVSPSFKKRANEAAFWEAWVGAVLARGGLYTLHHPFVADGGSHHGLTWDLDVGGWHCFTDGDYYQPPCEVECKSLNLTFTCPKDYPFDTCLVCSANSWERKWGEEKDTQRDFLFISRETGAILWLPRGAPVHKKKTVDGTRDESYWVMYTDKRNLEPLWDFIEEKRKAFSL